MAKIDILSIGNSYSQDAQRYLYDISRAGGDNVQCVNLYIGGCSLDMHFRNMMRDDRVYDLQINGHTGLGFKASIKEALLARSWDFVTLQQASHFSYRPETYFPYIERLAECVREYAPGAKLLIHQTWGYESLSERIRNHGFETYDEMFEQVEKTYDKVAKEINADGILRSGKALSLALEKGIPCIHRDTFHLSLGVGRFIAALTWYKYLTGNDISELEFSGFDVPVSPEEYKIAIEAVNEIK